MNAAATRHPQVRISAAQQQLTFVRGQTHRLPKTMRSIRVVAGCAWVTFNGEDLILIPGDSATFSGKDYPVLTAMGRNPLVIEVPGH